MLNSEMVEAFLPFWKRMRENKLIIQWWLLETY